MKLLSTMLEAMASAEQNETPGVAWFMGTATIAALKEELEHLPGEQPWKEPEEGPPTLLNLPVNESPTWLYGWLLAPTEAAKTLQVNHDHL